MKSSATSKSKVRAFQEKHCIRDFPIVNRKSSIVQCISVSLVGRFPRVH